MEGVEKIICGKKVVALIVRGNAKFDNPSNFVSEKDYALQLGFHQYKSGHIFKPHLHRSIKRVIETTQEVLYIKTGSVAIDFYGNDKRNVGEAILSKGDVVLFISGGHGIRVLKDTEIFEVKQGPYADRKRDKEDI